MAHGQQTIMKGMSQYATDQQQPNARADPPVGRKLAKGNRKRDWSVDDSHKGFRIIEDGDPRPFVKSGGVPICLSCIGLLIESEKGVFNPRYAWRSQRK